MERETPMNDLEIERDRAVKAEHELHNQARELHQQKQANAALTSERDKLQGQHDADAAVAAFRARCSAIMAAPGASSRYRQAAAFAIETDMPADVVCDMLAGLPTDAEAGLVAGASAIGATKAVKDKVAAVTAERARIGAILTSPEAQGREASAIAYALKGALSAEMAIGLLSRMAKVKPPKSIAEREEGMNSFGPSDGTYIAGPRSPADLFAQARKRVGAESQVIDPDKHGMGGGKGGDLMPENDPTFGRSARHV
jgi:hypothetical protein